MTGKLVELLQSLDTSFPDCGCISRAPADRWDDATVVGNGVQGALAYCRTGDEELVLSHEELFLPMYPFYGYLPLREHITSIRQRVVEGRSAEVQELLNRLKAEGDFPRYNTTDPFVGACSLDLLRPAAGACGSYLRTLDFSSGEALVAWQEGAAVYHRRFFASRAANLVVLKLSSPSGGRLNLAVRLREILNEPSPHPAAPDIYGKTIDRCETSASETVLTHRMHFKHRWATQPIMGSCTIARIIPFGGSVTASPTLLSVSDAEEVLLLIRTVPDRTDSRLSVAAETSALMRIEPDYDALLGAHARIHGEIFGRCTLQLSDPAQQQAITEELQASSAVGKTSPALVEKAFAAGRYAIISSTGTRPPLLQGVWTGTWKPRWSGDYTLNGNVQAMVAASLCGNHYECLETLMDYLDSRMDDFRENARELLGSRGLLIPWRSSTHGRTHYLSCFNYYHDFPGVFWFAGAGWFAQLYYDYYLYTGDEGFFEARLKPFLLDAVALYEDFLCIEQDGRYVLAPSSSPENETEPGIWIAPNATMTIAVIKQLLRTLLRLRRKLGATAEQAKQWQAMLSKMPSYAIGLNGALKEWTWPGIENQEAHRHASHLYPLFFGVDPEIAESPELREACRVAIDKRMDFRRPEDGLDMAFGFVQLGLAAAHLGDTALAYESVEYLVNHYWSPAMVSMHNVKDVFNVDISGGLPALIISMLIQSDMPEADADPWIIRLLPCLPAAWPQGRLRGVRCRGGFEVDLSWRQGRLTCVSISSRGRAACRLVYGEYQVHLQMEPGEKGSLASDLRPR